MVRRGCERNVITYSSLISACEKAGRWELALELFREMHTEGCRPNVVTYNSLIAACAQGEDGGCMRHARNVRTLHGPGGAPSSALLCTCCQRLAPACILFGSHRLTSSLTRTGCRATPAPLLAGAQWEKAQELFEQMQHRGCKPDAVTFSGLISSYDRAGE